MPVPIRPYILAGGLSLRMGRDKAMLPLLGKTLLRRAVETLKKVQGFTRDGHEAEVTLVGRRTLLEGADRAIEDRRSRCGPLGGIEAALEDLERNKTAGWAFFSAVDMPFLPSGLIDALIDSWNVGARPAARVCYAVVDLRPQPLVSMVHRDMLPVVKKALAESCFKVTPVLQSACRVIASSYADEIASSDWILLETAVSTHEEQRAISGAAWQPTEGENRTRHLWFANLNTGKEFVEAETFLASRGLVL